MSEERKFKYSSVWTVGEPSSEPKKTKPAASIPAAKQNDGEDVFSASATKRRGYETTKKVDVTDGWADVGLGTTSEDSVPAKTKPTEWIPPRRYSENKPFAANSFLAPELPKHEERVHYRKEESPKKEEKPVVRYAPAEKPPVRNIVLPCSNGYCGRVSKLEEMAEDSIPGKLTRWFTSIFAGDPYSPSKKGYTFFLLPDNPEGSTLMVRAYGDLRLANGQHLCIKGRLQDRNSLVAQRIWWDTRADSMGLMDEDYVPDWARLTDPRGQSAAVLRILLLVGIAAGIFLVNVLFNGVLMPLLGWLAVEGPSLIVLLILILVGIGWLRRSFRRFFRWR